MLQNLRKSFANNSSVKLKLSKAHLSEIIQSGGFQGKREIWFTINEKYS